jgi:hypothetical protein
VASAAGRFPQGGTGPVRLGFGPVSRLHRHAALLSAPLLIASTALGATVGGALGVAIAAAMLRRRWRCPAARSAQSNR